MNKIFLLGWIFSFSFNVFAWTLNNNFGARFADSKINVYVDRGTVCPNNALTSDEVLDLIAPAVDSFWNEVPTSSIRLQTGGFSDPIFTMNQGRLCSPSDDECINEGTIAGDDGTPEDGLIPAVTDIVIACNSNPLNFGGGNVLAVTVPNRFSGKDIKGAVILINETSTAFGNLSRSDQVAVIAHEIGHAIGLGHSKDSAALMYYRTVNLRNNLGQDDIDGVSFLYPVHLDLYGLMEGGLFGACGRIETQNQKNHSHFLLMGMIFSLMVIIFEFFRKFKKEN